MQLKALIDTIAFEAKLTQSIDTLGGWIELTIREMFDDYTAQVKYDELFVPAVVIALADTTGILPLPSDLQHLDLDNIRYRSNNDASLDYTLTKRSAPWGENMGRPRFIFRDSTTLNLGQFNIWPTAELTTNDKIILNYWRKAVPEGCDEALVLAPDQLIPVVKRAVIARASLFGDSKQYQVFKSQADEAHSRSMGATDVGSTNG